MRLIFEGARALPFMKATYNAAHLAPLVGLPPEVLERVYMYCAAGSLTIKDMRRLYPASTLCRMPEMTDLQIVERAIVDKMSVKIPVSESPPERPSSPIAE